MAFDENKVMWTTEEIMAAAAGDRIYEKAAAYVKEHPDFGTSSVIGLLALLAKDHVSDMVKLVKFLFAGSIRGFIDRAKDLLCMLERDNNWIA